MENESPIISSKNPKSGEPVPHNHEELKTYLKIKKVNTPEDKSYIKISKDKTKLNLIDNSKKIDLEKTVTFENNKIFVDDENSYIYEEVCRDSVKDYISGQNYCFIGYGLTHSGKTGCLIGGKDCESNINNRGMFFRFLESLKNSINNKLLNQEYNLTFSYVCVNSNKYVDLLNLRKLDLENNFSENDLTALFMDYKATTDLTNLLLKSPIGEINEMINFYTRIRSLFVRLEHYEKKYYSKSHFALCIYLTNLKTLNVSTCIFTVLAGSEKTGLNNTITSPTGKLINGNISKTRDGIYIQNSFSTLLNVISQLKSPDFKNDKFNEIPFDDSALTYCLKFYLKNCKIRIIGTIVPNIGYQESVKDTLMYLFKFRKSVFGKNLINSKNNNMQDKTDEILYELENKLKLKDKHIQKLNEQIENMNKRFEDAENTNKKNLEILKNAFRFEGDIQKLNSNDEDFQEVKYARNVRDSIEQNRILNKKVKEYEKKIQDLKEEIKKVNSEKRLIEDDRVALGNYLKIKEENLHEENKMKILLENSKELDELKRTNDLLQKQITEYRKVIEENAKTIQNLPNLLKDNIEERKEIAKKREELKGQFDKNLKTTTKNLEKKYTVEIDCAMQKYESELKQKEETLKNLNDEFSKQKMKHEEEINKLNNEMMNFYELVNPIFTYYKIEFEPILFKLIANYFNGANSLNQNLRLTNNGFNPASTKERITSARITVNTNIHHTEGSNKNLNGNPVNSNLMSSSNLNININLKNAKEAFDKLLHNLNLKLNRYYYPILFNNIDHMSSAESKIRPISSKYLPRKSLMDLLKSSSKFQYINNYQENQVDDRDSNRKTNSNQNNHDSGKKSRLEKNKNNINLGSDLEMLMEMNTNNLHSKNHTDVDKNKELSISASDISIEMEKFDNFRSYTIEEIEKMQPNIVLKLLNDASVKVKNIQSFFNEVKKEKRGYNKFIKADINEISKEAEVLKPKDKSKEYIRRLENENSNMRIKFENLKKTNLELQMKKDTFETKLLENISTNNVGFNFNRDKENVVKNKTINLLKKNSAHTFNCDPKVNQMSNMIAKNFLTANTKLRPMSSNCKNQTKN